ncbi:MAG: OmpH family outer membrane protein [Candidatus Saccharimonadales bacterium]
MSAFKRLTYTLLIIGFVALPFVAFKNAQAIEDWWRLRSYTPPPDIVALASANTMTESARRIFYVNHPELIGNVETFRTRCPQGEQTIVLGCYHSDQEGIIVYDVQDKRLGNVQEVTAAHELLHAAYDRLNDGEKEDIDAMLQDYYQNRLSDRRIQDTIQLYKKTEPNELVNEMHSIFGTEISDLPAPLEAYYSRYFSDRQRVVKLANSYEAEFQSRQDKIKDYERQLNSLREQIKKQETALQNQLVDIESERQRLDSLRTSGRTAEYNGAIPGFNSRVRAYNTDVRKYKNDVAYFNDLVEEYQQVAGELQNLYSAIDTRLTTQDAR